MSDTPSKLEILGDELEKLRSEISDLDAIEEPSEEQTARFAVALTEWDEKKAAHDALAERAAKVEAVRAAAVSPANREAGAGAPAFIRQQEDPFADLDKLRHLPESEVKERALRAFDRKDVSRSVRDEHLEVALERIESVRGAAEHALVHGSPAYRAAFDEYMRTGGHPFHTPEQIEAVRAAMALGNSTGGYTLPTLLDPTLIHTGTASKNPLRSVARIETGTQNVWHGASVTNVTTAWLGEASAMSDGSPTFAGPSVTAAKLAAYVTASYEIFEDSNLQAQLPGLIGEAFSFAEQDAFISGSGSNAPRGIITAISATAASTVTATTRGAFTSASAVDVFALVNALPSRYEDSSTWVANKATFNTIRQMSTGSQGSYFWTNFNNTVAPNQLPLLGSPTLQASAVTSSTTSGNTLIVLGDFSQFLIYDRLGTQVEFVQNVVDTNGNPTGQRGLIAHKRVGSDITDVNAFRFLKC